ncbi:hypothetical protein CEB94_12960 [Streptomyces hawaiiensis]|uniref:Uncharacterized protein n=1 Tax=Streptomyces hawaiiensis TaxID=67305 RepID=A0A6G5RBZ8_9ACTN|nr:hypothetical protein CEB94_12960 [Streptomyces hawaiiensis]
MPAPAAPTTRGASQVLSVVIVIAVRGVRPCRPLRRATGALGRSAVVAVPRLTPPQRFGRGAAPRAGKGAVEVPSARVAVVHLAGRLSSAQVTFLDPAVKVL